MIKLGLVLLIICAISAFILGVTNDYTQGIIQARAHEENVAAIKVLLPEAEEFELVEDANVTGVTDIVEVYQGTKNGEVIGYTVKSNPQGYAGRVDILIGISIDGIITGAKVGDNTETPGLGTRIADAAFINQFLDKATTNEFQVTKDPQRENDIETVTGATVSSEAVARGINRSTQLFEEVLKNR